MLRLSFWLASRPEQALVWGQAGGSLKADSAGVWWSSMKFENRIQNATFIENQNEIEKDWHKTFGVRKNEIVFIGQNMNEKQIKSQLDACLSTDKELATLQSNQGYADKWAIEKVYAME